MVHSFPTRRSSDLFWHSVGLVIVMGIIVMLQAYVFQWMVPSMP